MTRRLDEAAALIDEAVEEVRAALGEASTWHAHWLRLAGQISLARDRPVAACDLLGRAQAAMAAAQGTSGHPEVTRIMGIHADALAAVGDLIRARALAHEAWDLAAMVLDDETRLDVHRQRVQRLEAAPAPVPGAAGPEPGSTTPESS